MIIMKLKRQSDRSTDRPKGRKRCQPTSHNFRFKSLKERNKKRNKNPIFFILSFPRNYCFVRILPKNSIEKIILISYFSYLLPFLLKESYLFVGFVQKVFRSAHLYFSSYGTWFFIYNDFLYIIFRLNSIRNLIS